VRCGVRLASLVDSRVTLGCWRAHLILVVLVQPRVGACRAVLGHTAVDRLRCARAVGRRAQAACRLRPAQSLSGELVQESLLRGVVACGLPRAGVLGAGGLEPVGGVGYLRAARTLHPHRAPPAGAEEWPEVEDITRVVVLVWQLHWTVAIVCPSREARVTPGTERPVSSRPA
jgi:hypothetical protein